MNLPSDARFVRLVSNVQALEVFQLHVMLENTQTLISKVVPHVQKALLVSHLTSNLNCVH